MKRLLPLLLALTPVAAERYSFRAYGQAEGLLNPIVRVAAQDATGFLWVVTAHGVYRFDGDRMEYMHGKGLAQTDVRWVHCASDGSCYFRTINKIFRHAKGAFDEVIAATPTPAGLREAPQTLTTAGGQLWFVTDSRKLERIEPAGRKLVREEPAGLWSLLALRDGSLLAGCGNALCQYQNGQWNTLKTPADRYVTLHEGRDGTLYARGRKYLLRRSPGETAFEDLSSGLPPLGPDQTVPALATDFHRRPLTNTESGVARFENGRWQIVDERNGLNDQTVRSITVDREGGIWLGTFNGFWRWLGDGAWRLLGAAEGLPRRGADMAAQDKHGDVWVTAGPAGVYRGRAVNGQWRFAPVPGMPASSALLTVYRDDAVWVGPHTGGIVRRDTATGRLTPVEGIDPAATVHDFSIDHEGRVVAVTSKGFYRERAANMLELVFGGRELFSLSEDSTGAMWVGGVDIIARVRGSQVEVLRSSDGVEKNGIRALHAAPDGRLWTGTWRMDGLRAYRPDGQRLIALNAADAPPEKISTFFIRRDRRNRVWAGTVRGMSYFDGGRWHSFGRPQGLSTDHCTNACFLRDGSIWFATSSGLAQYTPPLESTPADPPALYIKSVSARFGPVSFHPPPAIPANQNDLEVDFGVLSTSLDAPPNVRYRLAATEPWRPARQRPLEFLNVAPGSYALELATQGRNGAWGAPLTLPFRVLPFWWQTWWFRLLATGALGGLGALVWNLRQRAAQRKNLRQLRDMIDHYPGVVMVFDTEGRFLMANRRLEEYTFQPKDGLIGKTPREVMSPNNATMFERNFQNAIQKDKPWRYTETYLVPGGTLVFDIETFPLRDQRGRVEALCAFATDVTERRRAEQERDQASQRYQAFVEQTREAIWRLEFEPPIRVDLPPQEFGRLCYERGVVREANQAAADFLNVRREDLVGQPYSAIRDRYLADFRAIDQTWYKNGFQLRDFEYTARTAHGGECLLLTNTIGMVEDGHLVRTWTTQRDVTAQRQAERERDQARQRYQAFVEQTKEAVWRIEYEPPVPVALPPEEFVRTCYERGFVREANQAAAHFLGIARDQLVGQAYATIRDRFIPDFQSIDKAWYENGFQLRDFEFHARTAAGEPTLLLTNAVGIVENGHLVRNWTTQRDVTAHRQAERERDQARQRYEAFVQQTSEAIWRIELEPPVPVDLPPREFSDTCYERAIIREANQAAASFLGVPLDQIVGRPYRELRDRHHPRNRAADAAWYQARFHLRDFESVVTNAQGEERILIANTVGIVENGLLVRSWSSQRDITDQRRLEELVANTARGVSAGTGQAFFDLLVTHLARGLQARSAMVLERLDDGGVQMLASAGIDNPTAPAVDWPSFDRSLTSPGEPATILIPLRQQNHTSGALVLGYASGGKMPAQAQPALEIFASRAAAELERLLGQREILHFQEQLRALTARTQQITEYERAHFAREIHDELGQQLTALKIGLSRLRNRISKGAHDQALEQTEELVKLTDDGVKSVRRVATELRPPALDQLGLAAAIRWQAKETQQRLGIPIDCHLEDVTASADTGIAAFRILQECLTNVMRHAHANHVDVRLRQREGRLELTVSDDGNGFDPATKSGGSLGLLGMRERAAGVRGALNIESKPGEGTTVRALLPLT